MRLASLLAVLLGCKSGHDAPKPAPATLPVAGPDGGFIAEPSIGGTADALPFVITKIVPAQQPATAAPWHADGGTWTYFEAHLTGDDAATFAALVPSDPGGEFDKIELVPTTAAAGARVVAAYANAFGVTAPAQVPGGVLQPLEMATAVLGVNTGRGDGFSGAGTWTATKLFCETDAVDEAEVFFNYSLAEQQGELSQKDPDYDADIASCLATALRDGAPPPRTPANDPTLATTGPTLVIGKKLPVEHGRVIAVTAKRVLVSSDDGTHGSLVAVDPATAAATTLLRGPDRVDGGVCNADASICAITLSKPSGDRYTYGSDDKKRVVLVVGAAVTAVPIEHADVPELSPDGTWVAAAGKGEYVAWNRTTKRRVRFAVADGSSANIYGWSKSAIAQVAISSYSPDKTTAYSWDLDGDGELSPSRDTPPEDGFAPPDPVSPDRTRRADFADGTLTITPLPSGAPRKLVFAAGDRRAAQPGCCQWLDSRYLELPGRHYGFIDTDTMKVSFVPSRSADDQEGDITIAPGMAIAVVYQSDGPYLATITKP